MYMAPRFFIHSFKVIIEYQSSDYWKVLMPPAFHLVNYDGISILV